MSLIPIRLLFRSRWAALAWAAGICLSAADFAAQRSPSAGGNDDAAGNAATALLGGD